MQTSRRGFLKLAGGAATGATLGFTLANQTWLVQASEQLPAASDPTLHLLNRLTYGPRPEDVAHAREIGLEAYLDEQLNPESIDDSDMDAILTEMPILSMSRAEAAQLDGFGGRAGEALIAGTIARAVHSKRQLYERMVEFWSDHFNIPVDDRGLGLLMMNREVIRKHALGNFRDLVIGTAQSPVMLDYLDQAYSDKDHPNENYARELLELHTLGVDGGYTEADVKEAARALTGWTIRDETATGFFFDKTMHDDGEKTILGHRFPAGRGIEDGLHLLTVVITHPSTAHYTCYLLCRRFVSDRPPAELVDRLTQVWIENQGEIKPVLRALFQSPEFMASAGQKLRRPLDFFYGALRATGTTFRYEWVVYGMLEDLAQPPFGWKPPDGYPDVAAAWINSGGLLARWNVAMDLTHKAYSEAESGMDTVIRQRVGDPQTVGELVDAVATQVFGVALNSPARTTFIQYLTDDAGDESQPVTPLLFAQKFATLYGLMLSSPMYQWR